MTDGVWRPRRTVLFTPATRMDRWEAGLAGPADVMVADLEDGVAAGKKEAVRPEVARVVGASKPGRTERGVRINTLDSAWAAADIELISRLPLEVVAVPKAQSPEAVTRLAGALDQAGSKADLLLILENAAGVLRADELARCPRVVAVAFGAEDYAASVGARRTREGTEVLWARSRVVAAAAAAGVQAIDQVFLGIDDAEGVERDMRFGAGLGYRGKLVIHPKQVVPVHRALRPTPEDVAWARKVVEAAARAASAQEGVAESESKMIHAPVVTQAQRILKALEEPE